MLDLAEHLRWLAQEHRERHIDRAIVEVRVVDDQAPIARGATDDGEGTALSPAQRLEVGHLLGLDGEHVPLLRLVAPDLEG